MLDLELIHYQVRTHNIQLVSAFIYRCLEFYLWRPVKVNETYLWQPVKVINNHKKITFYDDFNQILLFAGKNKFNKYSWQVKYNRL